MSAMKAVRFGENRVQKPTPLRVAVDISFVAFGQCKFGELCLAIGLGQIPTSSTQGSFARRIGQNRTNECSRFVRIQLLVESDHGLRWKINVNDRNVVGRNRIEDFRDGSRVEGIALGEFFFHDHRCQRVGTENAGSRKRIESGEFFGYDLTFLGSDPSRFRIGESKVFLNGGRTFVGSGLGQCENTAVVKVRCKRIVIENIELEQYKRPALFGRKLRTLSSDSDERSEEDQQDETTTLKDITHFGIRCVSKDIYLSLTKELQINNI